MHVADPNDAVCTCSVWLLLPRKYSSADPYLVLPTFILLAQGEFQFFVHVVASSSHIWGIAGSAFGMICLKSQTHWDTCTILQVTFAYGMGPLAWSIIAFRNSLVFHSLDKVWPGLILFQNQNEILCCYAVPVLLSCASRMALLLQNTSLFLHWFPAVVAWTQRWHIDPYVKEVIKQNPETKAEWNNASLTQLVFFPMVPYLAWCVAYYAKVYHQAQLWLFNFGIILASMRASLPWHDMCDMAFGPKLIINSLSTSYSFLQDISCKCMLRTKLEIQTKSLSIEGKAEQAVEDKLKTRLLHQKSRLFKHYQSLTFCVCVQIFVISSQKIQHKGYETLYKYTTRNPKAAVSRYVSSVPLQWQVWVNPSVFRLQAVSSNIPVLIL